MNNYEKLTLEKFKTNLKGGKYETLTGARRAIGKADWSNVDREAARATADKHFGAPAAGAPKAAATVAKPAKKAEKVAPVAAKKAAVAAPKAGKSTPGRNVSAGSEEKTSAPRSAGKDFVKLQSLELSKEVIAAGAAAIEAMVRAKNADSSIDVSEMQNAVNTVAAAVEKMGTVIGVTSTPTSHGSNGASNGAPVEEEEEKATETTEDDEEEDEDPLFNDK
jgi:hypothetical protein